MTQKYDDDPHDVTTGDVPKWARFTIDDYIESSDMGRDARFAPGWWVLPGLVLGVIAVIAMVVLL